MEPWFFYGTNFYIFETFTLYQKYIYLMNIYSTMCLHVKRQISTSNNIFHQIFIQNIFCILLNNICQNIIKFANLNNVFIEKFLIY